MTSFLTGISRRGILAAAALAAVLPFMGTTASDAASLEDAKARGRAIIGIQGDNPPWGFIDSSGKQDGFDAAMGEAFAKSLGLEVEFMPLAVPSRIPALTTGKVDVLFATMAMTEERAKALQYSKPYASNGIFVLSAKDLDLTGPEKLSGLEVGVPRSSTMDTAITAIAPADSTIRRFDDDASTVQALLSGQVQAAAVNQFYIKWVEASRPGVYENKFELMRSYNGAGTRLGEADWNEAVNSFLDGFMKTPEYAALYAKWLSQNLPSFPESIENIPFTVK